MQAFGKVAIRAAELVGSGSHDSAIRAWDTATREAFPHSKSMQEKGCPRATFLGLCEEGWVDGVPPGTYTKSRDNKAYGVRAAGLLNKEPGLASRGSRELWDRVAGASKQHNSQMDVVLALHRRGLLRRS